MSSTRAEQFREEFIAAEGPIIVARKYPQLRRTLSRWAAAGHLFTVAPGVLVAPSASTDPHTRIAAAMEWIPSGVVHGAAAAYLHGLTTQQPAIIEIARSSAIVSPKGFLVTRRRIPADHRVFHGNVCLTSTALTAIDLSINDEGAAIDAAIRDGLATVEDLRAAVDAVPRRRGNAVRRLLVERSASNPWSHAERRFHTILDDEGITGWRANHVVVLEETLYVIDAAFVHAKLAIEVDGWEFHWGRGAFENDRYRQNALIAAGWTILRFTSAMLDDPAYVVRCIRAALVAAR